MTVIDSHCHFVPADIESTVGSHPSWGVSVLTEGDTPIVVHREGFRWSLDAEFVDLGRRLADMDRRGIDVSVLSLPPTLFHYWIDCRDAEELTHWANDALAELVEAAGGRLAGLATLPMQEPLKAAAELHRAVGHLGLRGAQIGTRVEGRPLDDPVFQPVWDAAAELEVPVVLHPYYVSARPGFEDYYLTNLLVNPLETTLVASRLILSGTTTRYPGVRFMLVHGGGFLPYQIGRLDRGWRVRPETSARLEVLPSEALRHFYFDTVTHDDRALRWLIDCVSPARVLLGTDLPFDMADPDPVGRLNRVVPNEAERRLIAAETATVLFGLEPVDALAGAEQVE